MYIVDIYIDTATALIKLRQSIKKSWKKAKKRIKIKWQKKGTSACPIFVAKTYFEYDENFCILETRVSSR